MRDMRSFFIFSIPLILLWLLAETSVGQRVELSNAISVSQSSSSDLSIGIINDLEFSIGTLTLGNTPSLRTGRLLSTNVSTSYPSISNWANRLIAVSCKDSVRVFDIDGNLKFEDDTSDVSNPQLSLDGRFLAFYDQDEKNYLQHRLKVLDLNSGIDTFVRSGLTARVGCWIGDSTICWVGSGDNCYKLITTTIGRNVVDHQLLAYFPRENAEVQLYKNETSDSFCFVAESVLFVFKFKDGKCELRAVHQPWEKSVHSECAQSSRFFIFQTQSNGTRKWIRLNVDGSDKMSFTGLGDGFFRFSKVEGQSTLIAAGQSGIRLVDVETGKSLGRLSLDETKGSETKEQKQRGQSRNKGVRTQ